MSYHTGVTHRQIEIPQGAFEHIKPSLVAEPLRRLPTRVAIGPRSLAAACSSGCHVSVAGGSGGEGALLPGALLGEGAQPF